MSKFNHHELCKPIASQPPDKQLWGHAVQQSVLVYLRDFYFVQSGADFMVLSSNLERDKYNVPVQARHLCRCCQNEVSPVGAHNRAIARSKRGCIMQTSRLFIRVFTSTQARTMELSLCVTAYHSLYVVWK